ncbi:hypothetical protein [Streptomyces wuyuanensis]|uniref:hypothetical protein n=1 Tax=Streptomyces wuyuanensis TaxID=1196353 RepID=UPI003D74203B
MKTADLGADVLIDARKADPAEVLRPHVAGRTRVVHEPRPLTSVSECVDEVVQGHVRARILFGM